MRRLSLGLVLPSDAEADLVTALVRLDERADLTDAGDGPHDVILRDAVSEAARGERTLRWIQDADQPWAPGARCLVASPATARRLRGTSEVPVVALGPARTHADAVPVLPFTRARIRRARGLAEDAVGRIGEGTCTWDGRETDPSLAGTVAALAAVVVALDEPSALLAAAWAAPIVTAPEVAAAVGLPRAADESPEDAVQHLLADQVAAARAGHAAYVCFQEEHNPDAAVARIVEVSGVRLDTADDGYTSVLATLGTPARAQIRHRAAQATAGLRSR